MIHGLDTGFLVAAELSRHPEHQAARRDHRKKLWTLFCLATAVRNTAPGMVH